MEYPLLSYREEQQVVSIHIKSNGSGIHPSGARAQTRNTLSQVGEVTILTTRKTCDSICSCLDSEIAFTVCDTKLGQSTSACKRRG